MRMDALKFIKERYRMCDYYRGGNALSRCAECPVFQMPCVPVRLVTAEYIAAVEQWSREHPRKTRQSVFLEQYPEAQIDDNDVLSVCPAEISPSHRKDGGGCLNIHKRCTDCRREFWMQEVE